MRNFKNVIGGIKLYLICKLGKLNDKILEESNYQYALEIKKIAGIKAYNQVMQKIFSTNARNLKKKKRIKIVFIVFQDTTWSCDLLYRFFDENPRFEPQVVVVPDVKDPKEYLRIVNYYKNKEYKVNSYRKTNYTETIFSNKKTSGDIIFHTSPNLFAGRDDLTYMPLTMLHLMIPYTFWMDQHSDHLFTESVSQICWKFFCPSKKHMEIGRTKCSLGKYNMIFTGYPKMDAFYDLNALPSESESEIWKISSSHIKKCVKIIYAPGIVSASNENNFSTFLINHDYIYEYAKNHADTTSWVYKPHPVLRNSTVACRIFKTVAEYDCYEEKWRNLPNATVCTTGDYYNIFVTSDGMILDSISFLSGYQYVQKPLLFLESGNLIANEYGRQLMKVLYTAKGDDIKAIEEFIEQILILKQDPMQEQRKRFFLKYLDYKQYNNGKLASEVIFDNIEEGLFGKVQGK